MGEPQYAPNHTIDPATGFLESNAYPNAFNGERKTLFLKLFFDNDLRIRRTCEQVGISIDTMNRAYHTDQVFRAAYDEVMEKYKDELEGISRHNALNPKSVIERIFQLKCLMPDKYGQENKPQTTQITLNVDGKALELIAKRSQIIDVSPTERVPAIAESNTSVTPTTQPRDTQ